MPWFLAEKRGPQWKHGWREQALSSLSLPSPHLIAVFAIVMLFLSMSWYTNYKAQGRRARAPAAAAAGARAGATDGELAVGSLGVGVGARVDGLLPVFLPFSVV
ncbi:hypothetical protein Cni_G16859 [Canna indica]|uniref:Uncharacterized protein n=1 Tax=Canna indica TaxID=4628 RepID=A0AAQ3KH80_9LILI|nr:hypothetical protein Cni_G16859 [Canna indica]